MFVWAIGLTPCFVLRSRKIHKKRWRWPRPRRPRRLNRPPRSRISIPSSWVSFESRGDRRRRPRLRRRNPRKPPRPRTRCSKPSSRFVLTLFAHPRGTRITRYNCLIQPKQNHSPRSTPRTHRALTGTNQAPGAQRPSPIRAQVEQKIRGRHETKTQSHRRNGRRDAKPEQAVHRRTAQGSGRGQDEREIRRRVRDATRGESLFVFSYKAIRN